MMLAWEEAITCHVAKASEMGSNVISVAPTIPLRAVIPNAHLWFPAVAPLLQSKVCTSTDPGFTSFCHIGSLAMYRYAVKNRFRRTVATDR